MTRFVLLMGSQARRQNLLAGLAGLALGSLFGCALILWTSHLTPVVVHEAYQLDGTAPRNGHLDIYIDMDRNRDCPAETTRWLWTWVDYDGRPIKQFYPLLNTSATLSELGHNQHFILSIPIPPGVAPGQWYYWSKTVEHCSILPSLFRSTIRESGDIPVRITGEAP